MDHMFFTSYIYIYTYIYYRYVTRIYVYIYYFALLALFSTFPKFHNGIMRRRGNSFQVNHGKLPEVYLVQFVLQEFHLGIILHKCQCGIQWEKMRALGIVRFFSCPSSSDYWMFFFVTWKPQWSSSLCETRVLFIAFHTKWQHCYSSSHLFWWWQRLSRLSPRQSWEVFVLWLFCHKCFMFFQ